MEEKNHRLFALEGLRGVAAIVVVFLHISLLFYPALAYGPGYFVANLHSFHFEDKIYGTPLAVFFSGAFAVTIFFVLSGFVLSIGFFQTGNDTIIKKLAAKRYIRLMLPALVSVIAVWFVISIGGRHVMHLAENITHSYWLSSIWAFPNNLWDGIVQGSTGIFTNGIATYNPVLWTMKFEFFGSFAVFAVCLLFRQSKYRWIAYALLILGTFSTWYLGFILGMILADVYANRNELFKGWKPSLSIVVLLAGLLLGSYPLGGGDGTAYAFLNFGGIAPEQYQSLYLTIGALLVVTVILTTPLLTRFFGSRIISRLGKYTFSLYLVHLTVLLTFTAGIFVLLHNTLSYNWAVVVSLFITIPVLIGLVYLFERFVDAPSIRLSGVLSNWFLGLPQKQGVTAYSENSFATHVRKSYIETRNKTRSRFAKRVGKRS